MSIKHIVIKYGCQYKCGRKYYSTEDIILKHEIVCWNNPINQTCKTCKHEVYEWDSDDFTSWRLRECKISKIGDDECLVDEIGNIPPKVECLFWSQK